MRSVAAAVSQSSPLRSHRLVFTGELDGTHSEKGGYPGGGGLLSSFFDGGVVPRTNGYQDGYQSTASEYFYT